MSKGIRENKEILQALEVMKEKKELISNFLYTAGQIVKDSSSLSNVSEEINSRIQEASNQSRNGQDIVEDTEKFMKKIVIQSEEIMKKMYQLNEVSQSLITVINTLKKISSQTNLLALNASIEAARAGDAGRGFSVVAKEVRNLSEESANETKKAEESILRILEEINQIEEISQEGLGKARAGKEKVTEVHDIFDKINTSVNDVEKLKDQLLSISQEIENNSNKAHSLSLPISENREIIGKGLERATYEHN